MCVHSCSPLGAASEAFSPAAGCAPAADPLLRVESCSLQAILPLFVDDDDAPLPARLRFEASPLLVSYSAAQLDALFGVFRNADSSGRIKHNSACASCSSALVEAQQEQSRRADVIAHLLALNDELASSNAELRAANCALANALERHVAVVSTLASENAAMLERANE